MNNSFRSRCSQYWQTLGTNDCPRKRQTKQGGRHEVRGAYPPAAPAGWALPAVPAHKAHWTGAASRARPQRPQIGRSQPFGGSFAGGISAPYALKLLEPAIQAPKIKRKRGRPAKNEIREPVVIDPSRIQTQRTQTLEQTVAGEKPSVPRTPTRVNASLRSRCKG